MLSTEQEYAFEQFKQGKNIFITGPGGSGKSELIRRMAKSHGTQVCAMTGCAAVLLECNAKTVHSWAGIGIGDKPIDELLQSMKKRNKDMWKETQCLIVDEISMMSDTLFELLDGIGKRLRRSCQPFGGMQVVFVGDFYQLPPIENTFCFESPLWSMFEEIKLTKIFRQKDEIYQKILNQIRIGRITRSSLDVLTTRVQVPTCPCTKLFPMRQQVDDINQTEYAKLTGKEYTFGQSIKLKEGCHVMHTVNHDRLCNGSLGVVIGFDVYPIVQFIHGTEIVRPYKFDIPLVHAWAMTIHKAQGSSLDCAEIDAGSGIFECGQTYVALSRVRNLEGLYLTSLDITKIKIHPKLKK